MTCHCSVQDRARDPPASWQHAARRDRRLGPPVADPPRRPHLRLQHLPDRGHQALPQTGVQGRCGLFCVERNSLNDGVVRDDAETPGAFAGMLQRSFAIEPKTELYLCAAKKPNNPKKPSHKLGPFYGEEKVFAVVMVLQCVRRHDSFFRSKVVEKFVCFCTHVKLKLSGVL